MGTLSVSHPQCAGDKGLAVMLSGGTCWSLWERLGVWMTPTAAASGTPVIQLNPDCADKVKRVCAGVFASDWPAVHFGGWGARVNNKTRASASVCGCVWETDAASVCVSERGCPSCCWLRSHSCELGETQTEKDEEEGLSVWDRRISSPFTETKASGN